MRLPTTNSNVYRSVHTYVDGNFLTQNNGVSQTNAVTITATLAVSDFASWAVVFDQYRIIAAEVYFEPVLPSALLTGTTPIGKLFTVIDYDDATALPTQAAALAYDNCISTTLFQRQRRCLKPRIALAAYGSGAFTSYANESAPWIDCASPSVAHYGVKAYCDFGAAGALQKWQMILRTIVEFRAAR
jgi:hypothetical protein